MYFIFDNMIQCIRKLSSLLQPSNLVVPVWAFYVELRVQTRVTTFPLPMCVCLFVYAVATKPTTKQTKNIIKALILQCFFFFFLTFQDFILFS